MVKFCENKKSVDNLERHLTYVIQDDMYLAPGFFIVSEVNGEIDKLIKIYTSNNLGFPHFNIRAYQKNAVDHEWLIYRTIELIVTSNEPLYPLFLELSKMLDGNKVPSIDPSYQGDNFLYASHNGSSEASLIFAKEIYGGKDITDFIDINIGDNMTCSNYDAIYYFYNHLAEYSLRQTSTEDVQKILKITNSSINNLTFFK